MSLLLDKYDSADFDRLQFSIHLINEKEVTEVYPELLKFPEYQQTLSIPKDKVLKYIIYFYDKNSPLRKYEEDLNKRKVIAAKLAGFKAEKGVFSESCVEMMLLRNLSINKMICRYVRQQRSLEFSLITGATENFYAIIYEMTKPIASTGDNNQSIAQKQGLFKKCQEQLKEIRSLAEEMFSGDSAMAEILDEAVQSEQPTMIPGGFVEHYAPINEDSKA